MFRRKGIRPKLVKMDNEVSKKMVKWIENDAKLEYELVSPGNHRTNYAEEQFKHSKPTSLLSLVVPTQPFHPTAGIY